MLSMPASVILEIAGKKVLAQVSLLYFLISLLGFFVFVYFDSLKDRANREKKK